MAKEELMTIKYVNKILVHHNQKPTHLNKDNVNFFKFGKDKPIVCMVRNVVGKQGLYPLLEEYKLPILQGISTVIMKTFEKRPTSVLRNCRGICRLIHSLRDQFHYREGSFSPPHHQPTLQNTSWVSDNSTQF